MTDFTISQIKNFRFEKKFLIECLSKEDVESIIKLHPAMFREIYQERLISNIYLDTLDKKHYFENINGVSRRLKMRIRWYNHLFGLIQNPALELKVKHNMHVGKLSYPLESFRLDNSLSLAYIQELFEKSSIPETIKQRVNDLEFSLLNSYHRRYLLSADNKYRITLDNDIKVYYLSAFENTFLHENSNFPGVILELKYTESGEDNAQEITKHFPFRMTRSSKYVKGIESLVL